MRRRNDDPPLIGKVALITGGGSGIGKTTALLFAKKGCKAVIVSGRRAGPIEETAAEIEAMGVEAMAIPCDVADQANVQEMFGAVKAAVMAFSQSLAASLAPHVRVNCLAPGWIKTAWGEVTSEYWQQRAKGESLLGRWGTPEDVAQVARFLASPAAGFVTGQIIPVNGGFRYSQIDRPAT